MAISIIKVCEVCGKDISLSHHSAKYCSISCRNLFYKKQVCSIDGCHRISHGPLYCKVHKDRTKKGDGNLEIRDNIGQTTRYKNLAMVFSSMKQRCNNPNVACYHNYGGRGIRVCDRWSQFSVFLADMGEPPEGDFSIDRINNDGDYSPENCRWATREQQSKNSRVFKITDDVKQQIKDLLSSNLTYNDIAKIIGLHKTSVYCTAKKLGLTGNKQNNRRFKK
jgi:hypothetical protein